MDIRTYKHAKNRQQTIKKSTTSNEMEFEICVLCGKKTDVLISEPLEQRHGYLPGAGQLCKECALENIQEESAAMRSGFVYSIPIYEKDSEL